MKQLPDGCVDAVITSPPYNLGISTGGGFANRQLGHRPSSAAWRGACGKWSGGDLADGYADHDDAMPWPEYEAWQRAVLTACWRVVSDQGAIFYNHKPRAQNCELWLPTAVNPGLPLRQIIIWARAGGINLAPTHYLPTCEWILLLAKSDFRLRDKGASGVGDVWYIPQEPCEEHPAPFPEELPARILQTTKTRIVLDPFGGRGTTACAAKKLGRHFLVFEKSDTYCEVARKHLAAVEAQPDLFDSKAEQMSMDLG